MDVASIRSRGIRSKLASILPHTNETLRNDPRGPGGIIKDIANQNHYDGAGPEGLTLEIIGMGPAAMTPAEAK